MIEHHFITKDSKNAKVTKCQQIAFRFAKSTIPSYVYLGSTAGNEIFQDINIKTRPYFRYCSIKIPHSRATLEHHCKNLAEKDQHVHNNQQLLRTQFESKLQQAKTISKVSRQTNKINFPSREAPLPLSSSRSSENFSLRVKLKKKNTHPVENKLRVP